MFSTYPFISACSFVTTCVILKFFILVQHRAFSSFLYFLAVIITLLYRIMFSGNGYEYKRLTVFTTQTQVGVPIRCGVILVSRFVEVRSFCVAWRGAVSYRYRKGDDSFGPIRNNENFSVYSQSTCFRRTRPAAKSIIYN